MPWTDFLIMIMFRRIPEKIHDQLAYRRIPVDPPVSQTFRDMKPDIRVSRLHDGQRVWKWSQIILLIVYPQHLTG